MRKVELVADGDVISYMFNGTPLGDTYTELIDSRLTGITLLAVSESRQGVVYGNWGMKKLQELDAFLSDFVLLESNAEIANLCGGLLGRCKQIGRAVSWPDAWAAATAIWLDVPLVTHDWDLEKVPGLRVLTLHEHWESVSAQEGRFGSANAASGIAGRARIVSPKARACAARDIVLLRVTNAEVFGTPGSAIEEDPPGVCPLESDAPVT